MPTLKIARLLRTFSVLALLFSTAAYGQTISGHLVVCLGASRTTLAISTSGGAWSSGDVSKATIDASTGEVTGVAAGTSEITYTMPPSTYFTAVVTVNSLTMGSIGFSTGSGAICTGGAHATCTVTPTWGNAWSSSNPSIVTINTGGLLTSTTTAGTSVITYHHGTGNCKVTREVTTNPMPAVSAATPMCNGTTQTLTATPSGGTWVSSNAAIGSINSSTGELTGRAGGSIYIYYTSPSGCQTITFVSVANIPSPITGSLSFCAGVTSALASSPAGGTWSSTNGTVATIGTSTGVVTGVSPGTATISYTLGSSCARTAVVTVNSALTANTGPDQVCVGQTVTLSNATSGGTWSSSATAKATVNIYSGLVTGVSAGTANISYKQGGCYSITVVTVDATPAAITGATSVCAGSTTTLSHPVSGGTWSGGSSVVGIIGSADGVVTGVAPGVFYFTYTLPSGCVKTGYLVVKASPLGITGTPAVCVGNYTLMSNPTSGGVWSSSNASVATVVSSSGYVLGIGAGTTTISYTVSSTGCYATQTVTVNSTGSGISGSLGICVGGTSALTSSPGGGTWSSSNASVATVGSGSGVVSAVSAGTTTISYNAGSGCISTAVVTVNAGPSSITGLLDICAGVTTALTSSGGGGTWSSSNTTVGTVNAATGVVAGLTAGTTTISYSLGAGCYTTATVTVNSGPGAISGAGSLCVGAGTTLSNSISGGTWSSSNTAVGTIDPSSGVFAGISAGTTVITYGTGGSCYATAVMTVNAVPGAITGNSTVCVGDNSALSCITTGGSWSSGVLFVGTINSVSGIFAGLSPGITSITYTAGGCSSTLIVTVNMAPGIISEETQVCAGADLTLTNSASGGTWTSDNTGVATIGASSGIVTGITEGTSNISYIISTGCAVYKVVTVNASPSAITGALTVSTGGGTTLSNSISGGTWASSNAGVASVGSSTGIVNGIASGTATISYVLSSGCFSTVVVTVGAACTISGSAVVCVGNTSSLTSTLGGGIWTSSNSSIASVGSLTGVVAGTGIGTATIIYTATSCVSTVVVTVNSAPGAITGTFITCIANSTTLSHGMSGGAWVSGNTSVGTVNSSSGIFTGISAGTTTITYALSSSCFVTTTITVNASLPTITGTLAVCEGWSTTLINSTSGGSWSSSNPSVGSINSGTGVVAGLTAGISNITYTVAGCYTTVVITINSNPSAIGGSLTITEGRDETLSNSISGGAWSSDNTSVATIGSASGIITGVALGTATVSYVLGSGCSIYCVVTVVAAPAPITGTTTVDEGGTTTLSSTTPGGTWSSSDTSIATIDSATGVVTGVSGGTVTITYMITATGGYTTTIVTILSECEITGTLAVCTGTANTLSGSASGGIWSSSNTSVATVGSDSGVVTGIDAGTATISYTVDGCTATAEVTVNVGPAAITGLTQICIGLPETLSTATSGGTWSSSNTSVATIGTSGVLTGVGYGTATISYSTGGICPATIVASVSNVHGSISGTLSLCSGVSYTLTHPVSGGTWSSSTYSASIGLTTGVVTFGGLGTSVIKYTIMDNCYAYAVTTSYYQTGVTTGAPVTCIGGTTTLSNSTTGGTWSSSNLTVGSVGTNGAVTGLSVGSTIISYTTSSGCNRYTTVNVVADAGTISGNLLFCYGNSTVLTPSVPGGIWSSSNTSAASVNNIGTVASGGAGAATATITYTASAGCYATAVVTVTVPAVSALTGAQTVCRGGTTTFSSTTGGGTWSSSNTAVGTVSSTGVITGVGGGTTIISYILGAACYATRQATVNPRTLTGALTLCVGSTSTLTTAPTGGTWASGNTSVATVSSGVVTAVSPGTATISYTVSGCLGTVEVTVNAALSSITGTTTLCATGATMLSTSSSGGTWVSSNTGRATVGSATGEVAGVSGGTVVISYRVSTGCYTTTILTVDAIGTIGGTLACLGTTTSLNCTPSGGTWVSSNPSVVTIGSTTGGVSAVSTGTSVISYTSSTGCTRERVITIDALPSAITGGADSLCIGSTFTLSETVPGGIWTSSNIAVASANLFTGLITGTGLGTASIQYIMPGGCYAQRVVTVDMVADTNYYLSGPYSVIENWYYGMTLANAGVAVTGLTGTWSSSNTALASITASTASWVNGYGISPGTATISYAIANACSSHTYTHPLTVLPQACDNVWGTVGGGGGMVQAGANYLTTSLALVATGTPVVATHKYIPVLPGFYNGLVSIFDGTRFVNVANPDLFVAAELYNSDIVYAFTAVDTSGVPYYAYSYGGNVGIMKWNGLDWVSYTGHYSGSSPKICIDKHNQFYVAYPDPGAGGKASVARYNGTSWETLGGAGFSANAASGMNVTADVNGTPFVSFVSVDSMIIMKYNGSSWEQVGQKIAPLVGHFAKSSLKTDVSGHPVIAYTYTSGATNLYASRFDGANWVTLGSGALSDGAADNPILAIDPSGIPFVAYKDNANAGKTTVKKFNGSWSTVGTAGFTGVAGGQDMVIDNAGTVFVSDAENSTVHVWKFNGSSWEKMNGSAAVGDNAGNPIAMTMDVDTAYVAYLGNTNKCIVSKQVGNSWVSVGAEEFSSAGLTWPSMAARGGIVYVGYVDASAGNKATVMKYNGSSWSALGGTGISAGVASNLELALDNTGAPYIVYRDEANGFKTTVLKYNGSSWVALGGAGFSPGGVNGVSMAIDGSGTPYVSFSDSTNDNLVTVMKYNGSSWVNVGAPGFDVPPLIYVIYTAFNHAVTATKIKIDGSGTPYVAFEVFDKIYVKKFNGTDWVSMNPGPDINFATTGGAANYSFAVSSSGTPYVAFWDYLADGYSGASNFKIVSYNGYDWVAVGTGNYGVEYGIIDGPMERYSNPSLVAVNSAGVPYLAQAYSSTYPLYYTGILDMRMEVKKLGHNVINGNLSLCQGTHSYLYPERKSAPIAPGVWANGNWSSSNTSVATVDTFGVVTGIATGTAILTYAYGDCPTTVIVTVNAMPSAGTISGAASVATGSSITLSSSVSGGMWSTSSSAIATVGSASGSVTGVAAGSVTITYAVTGSCGLAVATHAVAVTAPRPGMPGSDAKDQTTIAVYPNPTSGKLNVETAVNGSIAIYTIDGRELKQYEIKTGVTIIALPDNLATGIYMLRFKGDDGSTQMVRLVYER